MGLGDILSSVGGLIPQDQYKNVGPAGIQEQAFDQIITQAERIFLYNPDTIFKPKKTIIDTYLADLRKRGLGSVLVDESSADEDAGILQLPFRFRINPHSRDVPREKSHGWTQTLGGWEYFYWDERPVSMTFSGRAAPLTPPQFLLEQRIKVKYFSLAYQKLRIFERFITLSKASRIKLIAFPITASGHPHSLTYREDAYGANEIPYSFKFDAYPDTIKDFSSASELQSLLGDIPGLGWVTDQVGKGLQLL